MKWLALIVIILISCQRNTEDVSCCSDTGVNPKDESIKLKESTKKLNDFIEKVFLAKGLVDITSVNSKIQIDLKYASTRNFMKTVLYDTLRKVYLQKEVAERLSKCQDFLDSIRPGYRLLVFDGVRPQQVQKEMWDALDSIPKHRRGKFVSNPALGSVHNFGAAVDLTIIDTKGNQLDMGAGYDDFREIAFPKLESHFLSTGELSANQVNNRRLLRRVMSSQKFNNIPSEWWHFNAYSRIAASHKFQLLSTESGSVKWFPMSYKKDSVLVEENETP